MSLFFKTIGKGRPLIILHGLFGSSDNWLTIAKSLEDGYQVILVDQRNHGKSFHSDKFNYEVMAEDVYNLLQEENIHQPIVMGHSMGGKTAMNLVTKFDVSIDKLIVVDIGPKGYPIHHELILKGLNSIPIQSLTSRKEADEALSNYVKELGVRQFLLKNLSRNEDGGFKWKINLPAISSQISEVGAALPEGVTFEHPSLFINGANSNYIEEADKPMIKKIFTNCQFETIIGAGHWVHAEKPNAFLQSLNKFLDA